MFVCEENDYKIFYQVLGCTFYSVLKINCKSYNSVLLNINKKFIKHSIFLLIIQIFLENNKLFTSQVFIKDRNISSQTLLINYLDHAR